MTPFKLTEALLEEIALLISNKDNNDAARDRDIAEHVLGQHRYRPPGDDGKSVGDDALVESLEDGDLSNTGPTAKRVKYDARLYGARRPGQKDPLSLPFLKKYIAFAKQRFASPDLTTEASESIAEYYAELRNSNEVKALPVTVRTLETIIRLACAHAKVRLSAFVEKSDVEEVMSLMDLIMKSDPSAQEIRKATARREDGRTKRPRGGAESSTDDESSEDEDADGGAGRTGAGAPAGRGRGRDRGRDRGGEPAPAMDEDISDVEDGAMPLSGDRQHGDLRETIRSVVWDLGEKNSGAASITGIASVLLARNVRASKEDIKSVLDELEAQEKIVMDGEDFYLAS